MSRITTRERRKVTMCRPMIGGPFGARSPLAAGSNQCHSSTKIDRLYLLTVRVDGFQT